MNEWFRIATEPIDVVRVDLSLPGVECFLPVAIICSICVLATVVWILAVQKHLSRDDHARRTMTVAG